MDKTFSISVEPADTPSPARAKRSRSGCLTCRNRRRKCDEGKPICQNCLSKKFECRYAAAFQILGKHNFTPEVRTDIKYASVRFAEDERDRFEPNTSDGPAEERQTGEAMQTVPNKAHSYTFGSRDQAHSGKDLSPSAHETALHGLLALAAPAAGSLRLDESIESVDRDTQTVLSFDFANYGDVNSQIAASSMLIQRSPHQTDTGPSSVPSLRSSRHGEAIRSPEIHSGASGNSGNFPDSSTPLSVEVAPPRSTSTDDSIELLKFYRYNIAPWLDICEYTQPFGVALLTKLNETPRVRACVLRLAATISGKPWTEQTSVMTITMSSMDEEYAAGVLEAICGMLPKLAASWMSEDGKDDRECLLKYLLAEPQRSEVEDSAYWLLVRLELSRALIVGDNRVHLPAPTQTEKNGSARSVAQYAYDVIALCVDAATLVQGDDDRWLQHRYGLNRVEVWKILVHRFAHWCRHRSHPFQPIIELYPSDGILVDDDYPTIVFTSGAALLANQLYHTGMLLLLQNKPRFANLQSQSSSSMSTLWHAHRICGIAIHNDRPSWWDPCLVASLIVAGRTATHASQHTALMRTLRRVQHLTGWIIDPYIEQMQADWHSATGW